MAKAHYKIDNDMTGTKEGCAPRFLNEEQRHNMYSVEQAEKHYKDVVYYRQRRGGIGWFHGRVNNAYREGYERTFSKK